MPLGGGKAVKMNEVETLRDLQEYRIMLQKWYNSVLLSVVNPEARSLFTRLRDDETRAVMNIQQRLLRMEAPNKIIHKIFPTRARP
jgi:hypothetical protein